MGQFDQFFKEVDAEQPASVFTPAEPAPLTSPVAENNFLPDDMFEEARKEEADRLRDAIFQVKGKNPALYKESEDLAKSLGLPPELVGRNMPRFKQEEKLEKLHKAISGNERLVRWALDEPSRIEKVEPDELDKVNGLNWLFQSTGQAWESGMDAAHMNYIRWLELNGEASPELIARADYLSRKNTAGTTGKPRTFGAESWLEKSVVAVSESAAPMIAGIIGMGTSRELETQLPMAATAAVGAAVAGQLGPQIGLPEEIITVPGAAITGFVYGSNYIQQSGSAYGEFREIVDETGTPLDSDIAKTAAMITGLSSSALDLVSLKKMTSTIPGMDKLIGVMGPEAMKTALKTNPTFRAALGRASKHIITSGLTEITTETAQTIIQLTAGELAKVADGDDFQIKGIEGYGKDIIDTIEKTAQVMTILGPLTASPRLAKDMNAARRARASSKVFEEITLSAQDNALAKRDPATSVSVIDAAAEGGNITEVHIPVNQLNELFQDDPQSVYDFGTEAGIQMWKERIDQAQENGGDVTLTIGEYYTHIAASRRAKEFEDIAKLSYLDPTAKEVEALNTSMEKMTGKLLEEARNVTLEEMLPEEQVYSDVQNRAQISGVNESTAKAYAELYKQFFKTMGDRTGMNPKELFDKYNLSIEQPDIATPTDGTTYNQVSVGKGKLKKEYTVYHGSPTAAALLESHKFDLSKAGTATDAGNAGTGVYTSPDPYTARAYIQYAGIGSGVIPLTVELENPLEITVTDELDVAPLVEQAIKMGVKENFVDMGDGGNVNTKWSQQFRDAVIALGHDGVVIKMDDKISEVVAYDPKNVKHAETGRSFGQAGGKNVRGSITFSDTGTAIRLFKAQNLSTFLHESGHFFMQVLGDLAATDTAPEQIKADWALLEKTYDFKGKPDVNAHERFARGFETYLMEGKAPSHSLRQVFYRMRAWLLAVYRHAARIGEIPSPEIRGIFDRMLASDHAIDVVKDNEEFGPLFTDPTVMSPPEWEKYSRLVNDHVDKARGLLRKRIIGDFVAKQRSDMAVFKKETKEQVKKALADSPVYKTIDLLKNGTEFTKPIRLDREEVASVYGEKIAAQMLKEVFGSNSMTTQDIAELTGWNSPDELINALASAKPFAQAVNEKTTEIVEKQFGDKFAIAEQTEAQANQAMHIDSRASILEIEIQALQKMGGGKADITPARYARHLAEKKINASKIKDVSKFTKYVAAERTAAVRADKAMAAGDFKTAAEFKRQQLFSHQMGKVAQETLDEVEQMRKYAVRIVKKPKKIDPDYSDQIKAILGRFEFTEVPLNKLLKRESLLAFVTHQEMDGNVTTVPEHLIDEAKQFNYRDLTVEEFQGLRDAVKNIEHLGKLKYTYTVKRHKMVFEAVRNELIDGILSKNDKRAASPNMSPTTRELFKENLQGLDASFLKVEQLVEWLDGADISGPARRYIFQPLADAEVVKNDMLAEYTAKIASVFEKVDGKYMYEKIHIPQIGKNFTRADIYGVALNMGNESNYDKMKRGEGKAEGGREWTDQDVESIVANLSKEDWDNVQQIWDHINSLWAQTFQLQRKLTGVAPKKIAARPVNTPHGQYAGGYYPIVYDRRRATDVANRETLANEQTFPNTNINTTTPHGHTKERAANYAAPMSFDLMVMTNHLNSVIHDLTHREAVRQVNKLLVDKDVAATIRGTLGEKYREQFTLWIKHLAHERRQSDQEIATMNYVARKVRVNTTMVGIGLRFSTVFAQAAGFSQAKEMVSGKNLTKGMRQAASHPFESWEFVKNASGEMRHRADQMDRDIREGILSLDKFRSKRAQIQRFAYYGVSMADRMVTVPTWMGAYADQMEKTPGNEELAVAHADKVVRLTQGSGGAKDLAHVQRGTEAWKLMTMFYSYFSALYARTRNLTRDVRRASMEDVPNLAARAIFAIAIPAVAGELLTGRGPEDDEDKAFWAAKKMILYPLMSVPFLRDVVSAFDSGKYSATPAVRAIETLINTAETSGSLVVEAFEGDFEEDTVRKFVKNSLLSAGYVVGFPTGQVSTTIDNIWRGIDEGNLEPRDLILTRRQ